MNDNLIIEGKFSKFNPISFIFLVFAAIFGMSGFSAYTSAVSAHRRGGGYNDGTFTILFLLAILFVILSIIFYFALSNNRITVTSKKVSGKVKSGKQVELPFHQISAIGKGSFNSITVSTSSGVIHFWFLRNRNEVFNAISSLLSQKQEQPLPIMQAAPQSSADELSKYKKLLDDGVITQEEFNAKKKQLLGL